jgi:hypothetical protein
MLNAHEADAAVRALPRASALPVKEREPVREANKVAEKEITAQFRQWLAAEYPEDSNTVWNSAIHDILWEKAWADGHHAGYHEVENQYEQLASFLVQIEKASKK